MKFNQFIDIAKALIDKPQSQNKHFSFIIYKNRIRAIGWNFANKTHPLSHKFGYQYPFIHSEVSAITRFDGRPKELKGCYLLNIRLNNEGKIMQSKPCKNCIRLISSFSFDKVFFSNKNGGFEQL